MKKPLLFLLCFVILSAVYASEDGDSIYDNSSDDTTTAESGAEDAAGDSGGRKISGGRSRESVLRVVESNVDDLKRTYSIYLRQKPNFGGMVTVRFAVNEHGKVFFARVVNSTTRDPMFDNVIMNIVRSWEFGPNHKPGDVTEITFPFAFTP